MKLGASVLLIGLLLGGIALGQNVRKSIASLDPNGPAIASLRKGIQTMQSRAATDPTSWKFQTSIHATYDQPINQQEMQTWNQCQHGQFFFLSWHRMYLYYFERILRAASGDASLTLPYWNYSDPTQRGLPLPFRQPADPSANPLFVIHRIWSTDWFMRKEDEIRRALGAFTESVDFADKRDVGVVQNNHSNGVHRDTSAAKISRGPRPPVPLRTSISEYREGELIQLLTWIASDGQLRTDEQIIDEMIPALGFNRRGVRIENAIRSAVTRWRPRS